MRGYAATKVFRVSALNDYQRARFLVDKLPEFDQKGGLLRCHEVVRAVHPHLVGHMDWTLLDGHYKTAEHTWLINLYGHILDVYAIARFPPVQLFDSDIHFHRDIFREGKTRKDIRYGVVEYLRGLIGAL